MSNRERPARPRRWPTWLLFGLLAAWTFSSLAMTVAAVWRNYTAIPVWDYWLTAEHLDSYRRLDLSVLWRQHNEHRIVFPEIAFAVDYLMFQGREILPLVLNVTCQFLTCLVFVAALYRTRSVPRGIALSAGLLCGVFLFWPGLALVLSQPFCLQWTLFNLFAALAFFEIGQSPNSNLAWLHLFAAITCAAVATYSSANGLGIWPLLLVAAFWLRMSWLETGILVMSAATFTGLYFVRYQTQPSEGAGVVLAHPLYWFQYVGCYLSLPFSFVDNRLGVLMGWSGVALTGFLIWRLRKEDLRGEPAGILYVGFCFLTLMTALLVSFSRMNLHDPDFSSAKSGRYLLLPALFWASLSLSMIWLVSRESKWRRGAAALLCSFAVFMTVLLPKAKLTTDRLSEDFRLDQLAAIGMQTGLIAPSLIIPAIFPNLDYPNAYLLKLRDLQVSVFADSRSTWLGHFYQTLPFALETRSAQGAVVTVRPVEGGVELLGWMDAKPGAKELIFVDSFGRVVGLAEHPAAGIPAALSFPVPGQAISWEGFVNLKFGSSKVQAWGVRANRSGIFPVGGEILLPLNL